MSRRQRIEFEYALYHVTARGNGGRRIVLDRADADFFPAILGPVVLAHCWELLAWCLMPNHYHLVLRTPVPNLSRGMHLLNSRLAHALQRRHGRSGHLFEGPYDAAPIEDDSHALVACRYTVLNPVTAGLVLRPEEWKWSSHRAVVGLEPEPPWLRWQVILESLGVDTVDEGRVAWRRFVDDRLATLRSG